MIELPDDELDKLFRKSSEELDPTYEPADWNALSKRLDQEDGRTPAGWFRKWWPMGLLALMLPLGLISYFLLKNADSDKNASLKNSKSVAVASQSVENDNPGNKAFSEDLKEKNENVERAFLKRDVKSDDKLVEKQTEKLAENKEKPIKSPEGLSSIDVADTENTRPSVANKKLITESEILKNSVNSISVRSKKLPRSRSKTGGVYLEPNRSNGKEGDGAFLYSNKKTEIREEKAVEENFSNRDGRREDSDRSNPVNSSRPVSQHNTVVSNDEVSATQMPSGANVVSEKPDSRVVLSVSNLDNLQFSNKGTLSFPKIEQIKQDVEEPEEERKSERGQNQQSPKTAIRVGYSPDLSTVGFKNFTKPGSAFSVLAEYGLLPRLYVQTGISKSVKDYYANASEYELMPYVTKINTPYNVDGTCNMLEIPLNIRYDFKQGEQSRWFAGTGFTSYNIQKEKYIYNYKKYVHGQKPGWEGKTGWYFLSHLNASVGYERRITNKLSILAEPYIRIPLKGIGYGKVNLLTTGMWLSVRYTPFFFKNSAS